jgi:hypothetical protein
MAMQRPGGRQTTRMGQPAAPAKAAPGRPATQPVPKQAAPAPATRGRAPASSTRSVAKQGQSRPVPKQAAKNNTMMFAGIGAGVLVLLVGAFFAMSGDSHKPVNPAPKEASKPKATDVSGLERDGMAKCEEGLGIIQKHQALLGSHSLSDGQKSALKADLEKSRKLIGDGMGLLTQANEKAPDHRYDTKQYQEALITVRKKLMELRD